MKHFAANLNFSDTRKNDRSVKIDRRKDINYYETLCLYCANNDIDLTEVDDDDFHSAGIALENYGKRGRIANGDVFYFWFD